MSASRRRRRSRLDPALRRQIDGLTPDPAVRAAFTEAMVAMTSPDAGEAYALTGPSHRAALLLAMRDAAGALIDRKPCDTCPKIARRIRFLIVRPGEDLRGVRRCGEANAFTGFAVLCDGCAGMPAAELTRRMLDKYAALQEELGPEPYRREAVSGPRVGEVLRLPPGHRLEECSGCNRPVWIDPDMITGSDREAVYLCRACAARAQAEGRLEAVPVSFVAHAPLPADVDPPADWPPTLGRSAEPEDLGLAGGGPEQ